jgi:hypothetical protein
MFHFPALPHTALCIQAAATPHDGCRVSPFGHPRITAWLPAPRGLSQAPTSFIGSWCQGVHRVLLETWLQLQKLDARVHCAVLKIRAATAPVQRVRAGRSRSCPRTGACAPVSSGPNSVPGSPAAPPPFSTPAGAPTSRAAAKRGSRIASAPLVSNGRPARHPLTEGARDSLERR